MRGRYRVICVVAALVWWGAPGEAQEPDESPEALRVFLDCGRGCDRDYLRREITFVNYVRDRRNSFFNDLSKYSTSVSGNLSFRVVRGLSLNVNASTSLVRDQLHLAKADLSDEEILLERRQLATDSRYSISFGFSYTFGSIFNNVVNPRF